MKHPEFTSRLCLIIFSAVAHMEEIIPAQTASQRSTTPLLRHSPNSMFSEGKQRKSVNGRKITIITIITIIVTLSETHTQTQMRL